MLTISIGTTARGQDILISLNVRDIREFAGAFECFSERDKFDALLAIEYLLLGESRRDWPDEEWLRPVDFSRDFLLGSLSPSAIDHWKRLLGINSAFAARDYGKSLVHAHFRKI